MKTFFLYSLLFFVLTVPVLVFAQTPGGDADCPNGADFCFPNPFGNNIQTIPEFLKVLTDNVILPIGAIIVVIMVIYSGFLFVTAQGSENKISDAKKSFTYAVIGAVILLGAWVIANVITQTVCQLYAPGDAPAGLGC